MVEKLNRDVIARAGLKLLDKSGIEGITMRELAAELGVRAPTLYWHVKSKQDIFRTMAVTMSADAATRMATLDPEAPWQDRIMNWAVALRRTLLEHRDGARVFAGTFAADPATFQVTESVLRAWRDGGLPIPDAALPTALLRHFIVGFCIEEQALEEFRQVSGDTHPEELSAVIDPATFPLTAQAFPVILGSSPEHRFELGIRLMLSGIAASSATA
ncbi:TetR/AcrR family transcriptional regulator C-terminal domain-containing protein [Nocardia sp. NPDC059229]|uniref:TetR/AcrR family transcriptional regulator C-terminal domain-containing protein n=1 Tax=Nocardia sp. NPDC059229 TaxID=3346778 RepID=UPI0036ABF9DD